MADDEWSNGICPAEPGLPKLLLLSLERIGVVNPPTYTYRECDSRGTLRCDMMISVDRSTLYPDVEPWTIATSGACYSDTYQKAARKALRHLRIAFRRHLRRTPMGFFPPTGGRGRSWISRMRGLGKMEEDLEDTVSHLSIYLTGLDKLYRETAAQLKHQISRAQKAELEPRVSWLLSGTGGRMTPRTENHSNHPQKKSGYLEENPKKPIGIKAPRLKR